MISEQIIDGIHDDVPEQAFYMVGTIDEALKKAKLLTGAGAKDIFATRKEGEE